MYGTMAPGPHQKTAVCLSSWLGVRPRVTRSRTSPNRRMAMSSSNLSSAEQEIRKLTDLLRRVPSLWHSQLLCSFARSSQAEVKELSLGEEKVLRKAFEFLSNR